MKAFAMTSFLKNEPIYKLLPIACRREKTFAA
jgi:hypothetical protein